ncbi:uncharacterized protein LOC114411129 [Glycine soja]|uniref:uncharacterized protein n=1 Tax=Glycine max TaxID=3847 RepID=UPI0003DE8A69|nr:uncharacterized protein LOC102666549 [Glycine max]XP_028230686.1 uncharacterized protein LOC114411129 [Glycine soja]|eukprot:XP_006580728.1 uncharacterized protein LOC102666549 [Glycine max]
MMDNIFLVQEILRKYARKRSSPRCLLKIDLHKAYDSISWEFLDWMLKSIGFPAQFCIQLSHLAFAYDVMLLSRGDIPSVSTMFAKLQHFCRVSGLSISSDKSSIYSAGIRPHELSHIQQLTWGWSKKSLSYAGKLELIRAVIQGIVNFWMGIFPLPQSVMDRINASCRNFLWGKVDIGKNKPLVT